MRLNKLIFLFWSTLAIGALAALATGLIFQITDREFGFMGYKGIGFNFTTMLMGGLMFSVVSQMGFFAYLMVNYIALSIFRRKYLWNVTQVILIVIVLFDLAYLPYLYFNQGNGIAEFIALPAVLLIISAAVMLWKVRMTNPSAWIPTLFFMVVATVVETVPGLQQNNLASTLFMGVPIFVCNAWQILMLHRLIDHKKKLTVG